MEAATITLFLGPGVSPVPRYLTFHPTVDNDFLTRTFYHYLVRSYHIYRKMDCQNA